MSDISLGAQIKRRRERLRLTQRELADRAGLSIDLIRKLEQGIRLTAGVPSLQRMARALDVTVAWLFTSPVSLDDPSDNSGVLAMRRALTPVDDLVEGEGFDEEEALTLVEATRTVDYLWGAYWSGKYDLIGKLLPTALAQARATYRAVPTSDRALASAALSRAYQVAGDTLIHLGHHGDAWLAAREALDAAKGSNDELDAAAVRVSFAWQLLIQGRYLESEKVAKAEARRIEPTGKSSPARIAAYGTLAVTGATAAARGKKASSASELLGVASDMAARLGADQMYHQTTFGPAKVSMLAVDVAVVQDDWTGALRAARTLPRDAALPLASRARHLADVALAHTRLGHNEKATDALLAMEEIAPEWIKYQNLPKSIAAELDLKEPPTRLRELVVRLGVRDSVR